MVQTVFVGGAYSPVGSLWLATTNSGVLRVEINTDFEEFVGGLRELGFVVSRDRSDILREAVEQLGEYFKGFRKVFKLELDLRGTVFQKKVWKTVAYIPYGEVRSYREVAVASGYPKAYRAVGNTMAANPVAIIIPCHRVVHSDNTLGHYGGNEKTKVWLLRHEGLNIKECPVTHRSKVER